MVRENPEVLEMLRMRFLKGYVIGVFGFLVLWFARFFFRSSGLNAEPVGWAVLAGLIVTAVVFSYFQLRLAMINTRITKNPGVGEAVNNEFYQFCAMRAWKPAFIGSVSTTLILALVAFVYPVIDLMFVALSSIVVGSFVYLLSLYLYWRAA